jgi:hypothetical protein
VPGVVDDGEDVTEVVLEGVPHASLGSEAWRVVLFEDLLEEVLRVMFLVEELEVALISTSSAECGR